MGICTLEEHYLFLLCYASQENMSSCDGLLKPCFSKFLAGIFQYNTVQIVEVLLLFCEVCILSKWKRLGNNKTQIVLVKSV